jgi:hypothetical protein
MKTLITSLPAIFLGTTAALAATSVSEIDMNNDDFASFEELSAAYSGLSMEEFEQIDANSDNRVSSDELYAPDAQQIVSRYEGGEMPYFVIDLNGDGFAEYDEITTVFTGLTPESFEIMDTNDDNRLSQVEVNDIEAQDILNRYRSTEDVATIAAADVDQSGFLSSSELMAAYPGLTEVEFDQIDENNDERVSYTELYATDAQNIVARYES